MHELELARKRMARYRILKILDAGRPAPVGEGLISMVLTDVDLQMTEMEIRKSLQYLEDKRFIEIIRPDGNDHHWDARLLPAGIDYLENVRAVDPGIARPER